MSVADLNGVSAPMYATGSGSITGPTPLLPVCSVTFTTPSVMVNAFPPIPPSTFGTPVEQAGFITVWGCASFEGLGLGTDQVVAQLGIGVDSISAFTRSHSVTLENPTFSDDSIAGLQVMYKGPVTAGVHTITLLAAAQSHVITGTVSVDGDLVVVFSLE